MIISYPYDNERILKPGDEVNLAPAWPGKANGSVGSKQRVDDLAPIPSKQIERAGYQDSTSHHQGHYLRRIMMGIGEELQQHQHLENFNGGVEDSICARKRKACEEHLDEEDKENRVGALPEQLFGQSFPFDADQDKLVGELADAIEGCMPEDHDEEGHIQQLQPELCARDPSKEFIELQQAGLERIAFAVDWLKRTYQTMSEGSVARCELFAKYEEMCREAGTEPLNMASLGKHVRALFPDIITRRLGNRGNSKYHYYGLVEKSMLAELEEAAAAKQSTEEESSQAPKKRRGLPRKLSGLDSALDLHASLGTEVNLGIEIKASKAPPRGTKMKPFLRQIYERPTDGEGRGALRASLGGTIPNYDEFAKILGQLCAFGQTPNPEALMAQFSERYQAHVTEILQLICERQFSKVEAREMAFWMDLNRSDFEALAKDEGTRIVSIADDYLYQVAVNMLLPDVLQTYPISELQNIRNFAKALETAISHHLFRARATQLTKGEPAIPTKLIETKSELARHFCLTMKRRTSVSHLAQAMTGVFQASAQVSQMIADWDCVDFTSIRDQANWITVEISVKSYLQEKADLPTWCQWMDNLIEQYIAVEMASGVTLDEAAKSLILSWSFYLSMTLRDLTLRSAASFGPFHLLRLLLDEYLLFFVEKKLDEHRRAVGVLSYWPFGDEANGMAGSVSSYSDIFNAAGGKAAQQLTLNEVIQHTPLPAGRYRSNRQPTDVSEIDVDHADSNFSM